MSVFDDNIKSRSITEQVFDFAWDEFNKDCDIHTQIGPKLRFKNGDDLYRFLVRNDCPAHWSYYIMKGINRLEAITEKTYDFHIEKWEPGNGYLTGCIKAMVVTEV